MSRSADVTSMKVREGEWVRVGTRGGMVGRVTMLTSEFIERAFFLSSGHVAGYKSCEDWLRRCCLMSCGRVNARSGVEHIPIHLQ